jgi:hypothetical protein
LASYARKISGNTTLKINHICADGAKEKVFYVVESDDKFGGDHYYMLSLYWRVKFCGVYLLHRQFHPLMARRKTQ